MSSNGLSGFGALGVEYALLPRTVAHLDYARYEIDGEPIGVISVGMSYRFE